MFVINIIEAFILTALIMGIIESITKLPFYILIAISIVFAVVMFFFVKELTGVSSFWDMFNFNFLKNL